MNKNNEIVTNMNTNFLKLIAIISMVIDHMGYALFSDNLIMRSIGRIAFPIFTYCAMIGYFRTNDLKKYISKIKNIVKVEFLPFHTLGFSKYIEYNIENPFKNIGAMSNDKCNELYKYFSKL